MPPIFADDMRPQPIRRGGVNMLRGFVGGVVIRDFRLEPSCPWADASSERRNRCRASPDPSDRSAEDRELLPCGSCARQREVVSERVARRRARQPRRRQPAERDCRRSTWRAAPAGIARPDAIANAGGTIERLDGSARQRLGEVDADAAVLDRIVRQGRMCSCTMRFRARRACATARSSGITRRDTLGTHAPRSVSAARRGEQPIAEVLEAAAARADRRRRARASSSLTEIGWRHEQVRVPHESGVAALIVDGARPKIRREVERHDDVTAFVRAAGGHGDRARHVHGDIRRAERPGERIGSAASALFASRRRACRSLTHVAIAAICLSVSLGSSLRAGKPGPWVAQPWRHRPRLRRGDDFLALRLHVVIGQQRKRRRLARSDGRTRIALARSARCRRRMSAGVARPPARRSRRPRSRRGNAARPAGPAASATSAIMIAMNHDTSACARASGVTMASCRSDCRGSSRRSRALAS